MDLLQKAKHLSNMFSMSESVCVQVLNENEGDVDKSVDSLLNMKTDLSLGATKRQVKEEEYQQLRVMELEGSILKSRLNTSQQEELQQKEEDRKKQEKELERLAKERLIASALAFQEERKRINDERRQLDQLQKNQQQSERLLLLEQEKKKKQTQRMLVLEEERKHLEEKKRQEQEERMELERIQKEEEDKWRRELAKAAEEKRKAEIEKEKARRTHLEKERTERERKTLEQEWIREREIKDREEEEKRRAEEELREIRAEREKLVEERLKIQAEIELAHKEAETERERWKEAMRKRDEEMDWLREQKELDDQVKIRCTEEWKDILQKEVSPIETEGDTKNFRNESDDINLDEFGIIEPTSDTNKDGLLLQTTDSKEISEELPLFTIYIESLSMTNEISDETNAIQSLLARIGVKDTKKVDLAYDLELASYIKLKSQSSGDLKLPLVFMRKKKVGDYQDLLKLHNTGELERLIAIDSALLNQYSCLDTDCNEDDDTVNNLDQVPRLGVLDRTLEGVETVVSYLNPLSWIRRSPSNGISESSTFENEFEVVHTNWYWRRLRRKIRFLDQVFVRINPKYGDVRAGHKYTEISQITISDANTLVFKYSTGASPDWFLCSPHDLQEILKFLRKKLPQLLVVDLSKTPNHNSSIL